MTTNKTITIYLSSDGYSKLEVQAMAYDSSVGTFDKTGLVLLDEQTFFIPYDAIGEVEITVGKDYIVLGQTDIEIDTTSNETMSNSLRALKEQGSAVVTHCNKHQYGTRNMWHYHIKTK